MLARIKAVSRRVGQTTSSSESRELFYDNLHINLTRYVLKVRGKVVETPPKELELLFFLASNPNRVFTRDQLLDEVWGFEYYGDSRTIDVHIKRLRLKLEGVSDKWALKQYGEWDISLNAMKNAADVKRQKSMKKQLIVQYLAAIAMLTLGAVFTGISVFAFSASYVKKSEYNEIDKTARTIIKNFEICLNSSDSRETAVQIWSCFFAVLFRRV